MTARVPANTAEVVGVGDIENDFGEAVNLGELESEEPREELGVPMLAPLDANDPSSPLPVMETDRAYWFSGALSFDPNQDLAASMAPEMPGRAALEASLGSTLSVMCQLDRGVGALRSSSAARSRS